MGKTIITHLLDGNPKGLRSIHLSNRTIVGFIIPKADLKKCIHLEELNTASLYILVEDNENALEKAYIGETDNFLERVLEHQQKKHFWDTALVFTANKIGSISKTDVLYLQYLAISLAKKIGAYNLDENKQSPKKKVLQRHIIDTVEDFFENIKFITEFAGYNIFKTHKNKSKAESLFYIKGRNSNAKGFYNSEGFTVLKGSIISNKTVPSFTWEEKRKRLINKIVENKEDTLVLKSDYTFSSPSTAADFCLGSSNNGWLVWKNSNNKTLDEIYRTI